MSSLSPVKACFVLDEVVCVLFVMRDVRIVLGVCRTASTGSSGFDGIRECSQRAHDSNDNIEQNTAQIPPIIDIHI